MVPHLRSILRSNTQSTTNTTKRVTWADEPFETPRRPPPSVVPPSRNRTRVAGQSVRQRSRSRQRSRPREREHTCRKHQHTEKEARRRRRADGVVKKRTGIDIRRTEVKKKKKKPLSASDTSKKKKKCKRGLLYARQYVVNKCKIKDRDILDIVDARTMYKIYVDVRRRLGKKVDQGLKRRMVEDETRNVEDRRIVRRKRRNLESFVNKTLPGVRAEAFSRSQLSRAAFAAVMARFDRVQRDRRI